LALVLIVASISISVPVAGAEKPVLTVWDWHTTEIPHVTKTLYEKFEKQYNCKLIVVGLGWTDLIEKVTIAAKGGRLPDVMEIMANYFIPEWAERGYLEILDPYIEKEDGEKFLAKYEPWLLWPYKGHTYGLPVFGGDYALFYNKTLFKEAGIGGPPTTWEELVSSAQKLTEPYKGKWGLALCGNDPESLPITACFIAQNGGRAGKVNGKIQINSPESVAGVQFQLDLINKYKVVPSYVTSDFTRNRELFRTGKLAMHYDGPWYIPIVQEKEPEFEWDTALLPKGKYHGTVLYSGDNVYAMSSNAKHKDLCWELIKFMTSEESNYYWMSRAPNFPAITAVAEREDIKSLPYFKPFLEAAHLGNAIDLYKVLPQPILKTWEYFKVEMQAAALGEKTAKQAMDNVAEKWQEMFDAWEKKYGKLE